MNYRNLEMRFSCAYVLAEASSIDEKTREQFYARKTRHLKETWGHQLQNFMSGQRKKKKVERK